MSRRSGGGRAGLAAMAGAALLAGALLSGAARPAAAAPRVTLTLDNATRVEALRAIGRAIGWAIDLPEGRLGDRTADPPGAPRARFVWNATPLGRVCRDLEAAFGDEVRMSGPRTLSVHPRRAAPRRSPYRIDRGGVSVAVTGLVRQVQVSAIPGEDRSEVQQFGSVGLSIRVAEGDADAIAGLEIASLELDTGELPLASRWIERFGGGGGALDTWNANVSLPRLPQEARRIRRLEGEVVLFRKLEWVRAEAPVPARDEEVVRQAGPMRFVVRRAAERRADARALEVEATWPPELRVWVGSVAPPVPTLRLRSGVELPIYWEDRAAEEAGRSRLLCSTPDLPPGDPPVALVWDFMLQGDPTRRVPFRLTEIPLPVVPGAPSGPPAPASNPKTGTLVSPVLLGDRPAPEGEVAFGLRRQLAGAPGTPARGGWGPLRWQSAEVDSRGIARLEGVPPGVYRVERRYRRRASRDPRGGEPATEDPASGSRLEPVPGDWLGTVVTVRVEPGREVRLPPLRRQP